MREGEKLREDRVENNLMLLRKGESVVMKAHNAAVRCVSFSRDGRQIVTCSDDKSIKASLSSSKIFSLSIFLNKILFLNWFF